MDQRENQSLSSANSSTTPIEDKSSDQIRSDIDRTRAEMDQTVDQLEQRLRPRHLLDDLLDYVGFSREQSAGQTAGQVSDVAKTAWSKISLHLQRHPISTTLIGAGITWMLVDEATAKDLEPRFTGGRIGGKGPYGNWRDLPEYSGSYVDARTGKPYDLESYGGAWQRGSMAGDSGTQNAAAIDDGAPGMADTAKTMASSAASKVSGAVDGLKDSASGALHSASDMMGRARENVAEHGHSARGRAGDMQQRLMHGMRHRSETMRRSVMDTADQYPLAVGAAALALGVVAGLLLPGTRREDELMGEPAERLADQAKDLGKQAMRQGKRVAKETTSAVTDEARKQGLDPDSLAEKVSNVARDVKEVARREGLDPGSVGEKAKQVLDRGKQSAKEGSRNAADDVKRKAGERTGS